MISSTRTLTVALGLVNALLATAASGADIRTLQLTTNDLIYDPGTGRIYASVPGRAPGGIGNSIVAIDPETGTIGPPVFVGSEPGYDGASCRCTALLAPRGTGEGVVQPLRSFVGHSASPEGKVFRSSLPRLRRNADSTSPCGEHRDSAQTQQSRLRIPSRTSGVMLR